MAGNPAIGINVPQPHGSWAGYILMDSAEREVLNAKCAAIACRFPRLRITSDASSANSFTANHIWASYIKTHYPQIKLLYGTSWHPQYIPTATTYISKILEEATWAQANLAEGDDFLIGNENELSGSLASLSMSSLSRTSNIATANFATAHGLVTGDTIAVAGASPTNFNAAEPGVSVTVTSPTQFTYNSVGTDGASAGSPRITQTRRGVARSMKAIAVLVRAIYTKGNLIYSVSQGHYNKWIEEGITPGVDVDKLALNAYGANLFSAFKTYVDEMWAAFGDNMIMTEVNVHEGWSSTVAQGSTPGLRRFERPYADENMKRVNYCLSKGIDEIYWFNLWNASSSQINQFTGFYHDGATNAPIQGVPKEIYYRLLGVRPETAVLGTQLI
jgi:hypothetical protein